MTTEVDGIAGVENAGYVKSCIFPEAVTSSMLWLDADIDPHTS